MFQQLKSTGYRKRLQILPPSPKRTNIRTFVIPDIFRFNLSNEPFLIHDSADPDRIIVFALKKSLNYLGMYIILNVTIRNIKWTKNNYKESFS